MPVPSSISDLSTTPSLNSPAGTESPSTVDDYLRTQAAFIRQVDDKVTGMVKAADLAAPGGSALVGFQQAGTGAVATTVQSKLREFVSVLDFGAVGDDSTDDTAAVQAAIDAVAVKGGTVLFPAGKTYRINGSLSALESVSVRLVGQGNTTAGAGFGSIIRLTATSGDRLIDARSSFGFTVEGLYIIQGSAAFSGAVIDLGRSAAASDSAYAIVEKNIFSLAGNAAKSVNVTKSIIITIRNNNFDGGARAVECQDGSGNYANVINIENNTFHRQTQEPVYNGGGASANWNIQKNTFEPLASGAAGGLWTKGITGLTVIGNYCGDANATGYWCVLDGGVSGAIITGNLFAMGAYGVCMQGATPNQGLVVTGNTFSGIATSDVFIDGASAAYGDICNNFHYLSTARITGALSAGRYQTDAAGANNWRGSVQLSNGAANGVGPVISGAMWSSTSGGSADIPLVVKGASGQVANLSEWRDSSGNTIARVSQTGQWITNGPIPSGYAAFFNNTSATSPYGIALNYAGVTGGAGQAFITAADSGATRFNVAGTGNVTNTNNSYGGISDIKLKENVTDATPKLDDLKRLRVVNYNLKESGEKHIGLIAQEVEQVFPGLVDEANDRDADGHDIGTTTKSVKYSVLVPMLLKAMQEMAAELEILKAEK